MECLANLRHSFLEQGRWQDIFLSYSSSEPGFTRLDAALVSGVALRCRCPGIFADWAKLFLSSRDEPLQRVELHQKASQYLRELSIWIDRWRPFLFNPLEKDGSLVMEIKIGEDREPGKRIDAVVLQESLIISMIRLYISIGGDNSTAMDDWGRRLATQMLGNRSLGHPACYGVKGTATQVSAMLLGKRTSMAFFVNAEAWRKLAQDNDEKASKGQPRDLATTAMVVEYLEQASQQQVTIRQH